MARKSPLLSLPLDQWTVEDWADLYFAMERVKRRIIKRHELAETPAVAASKVETRPAAYASRRGTGRRAPAQAPESGTPINPPISIHIPKCVGDAWADA